MTAEVHELAIKINLNCSGIDFSCHLDHRLDFLDHWSAVQHRQDQSLKHSW